MGRVFICWADAERGERLAQHALDLGGGLVVLGAGQCVQHSAGVAASLVFDLRATLVRVVARCRPGTGSVLVRPLVVAMSSSVVSNGRSKEGRAGSRFAPCRHAAEQPPEPEGGLGVRRGGGGLPPDSARAVRVEACQRPPRHAVAPPRPAATQQPFQPREVALASRLFRHPERRSVRPVADTVRSARLGGVVVQGWIREA
jgi:hypothetical protein